MGRDGEGQDPAGGQLDRNAELYRRLIRYSSDLIAVLEADGTIRFVSPAAEDLIGFDPTELHGRSALELIHPDDRERVRAAFLDLVEDPGASTVIEYRQQTAAGTYVWTEARGQNLLEDDVLGGIVVVARNVSQRIEREQVLETLHDRTRELLKADSKREIADLTAATASEVLGYPVTVVRLLSGDGTHLEPVAVTESADEVLGERPTYKVGEATAGNAFEEGEPVIYEDLQEVEDDYSRGDARAGLFVPIGRHGVLGIGDTEPGALDHEDIQLGRILAANAEVAFNRLEREHELQRQNDRLEEFASVISHDLRSPLNVAAGRLDLIETDPEQLEPIANALDRMEGLIEDVLALARQGQTVDETQPVALADVAEQCWRTVATQDATIVVETDQVIEADPGRLPEIFENLFRNAIEHVGADVTITVGAMENGFFVADDGPGIPPEHRERIFETGFSTSSDGTGFGLPIVKQIAEAHGWTVRLAEGDGARFEFVDVVAAADTA